MILAVVLSTAALFGVSVDRWVKRVDLRSLNAQYAQLCARMGCSPIDS